MLHLQQGWNEVELKCGHEVIGAELGGGEYICNKAGMKCTLYLLFMCT